MRRGRFLSRRDVITKKKLQQVTNTREGGAGQSRGGVKGDPQQGGICLKSERTNWNV